MGLKRRILYPIVLGCYLSCGVHTGNPETKKPPTGGTGPRSTITLTIQDAPIDWAEHFFLNVEEVRFYTEPGYFAEKQPSFVSLAIGPSRRTIDLLDFSTGDTIKLLEKVPIPAGIYREMRFVLNPDRPAWLINAEGTEIPVSLPPALTHERDPATLPNPIPRAKDMYQFLFVGLNIQVGEDMAASVTADINLRQLVQDMSAFEPVAFKGSSSNPDAPYFLAPVSKGSPLIFYGPEVSVLYGTFRDSRARNLCLFTEGNQPPRDSSCENANYVVPIRKGRSVTTMSPGKYWFTVSTLDGQNLGGVNSIELSVGRFALEW